MKPDIEKIIKIIKELNIVGSHNLNERVNDKFIKRFISNPLSGREDPFVNPLIKYYNPLFLIFDLKTFMFRSFDLEVLWDDHNEYMQNVYGFRSSHFVKEENFVFAGDSVTFGVGIPEKWIWGTQIANKYNLRYANVSTPGDSVQGIVLNLFAYFKEFGNPKNLFCLFPSFDRMKFPMNSDWQDMTISPFDKYPYWRFKLLGFNSKGEKFLKKPIPYDESVSPDMAFAESIFYIHMLEQYCRATGINLKWATWDYRAESLISEINPFEYFITLDSDLCSFTERETFLKKPMFPKCNHNELKDVVGIHFDKGTDIKVGTGHPGVHSHVHLAECFERYLVQ